MSAAPSSTAKPIGVSGLKHSGGIIDNEWLRQLKGSRGRQAIREMADNDHVVGGILFAIRNLISQMEWSVEPDTIDGEDPKPDEEEAAQFVQDCLHDMSSSWKMTLSEILTFLPYGFAPMEVVLKRRMGRDVKEGQSNHDDGKIGWRKWSLRSQDTLDRWAFDDDGGVQALIQTNPNGKAPPPIPIENLLLFRTTAEKGNPEGRSILRNAWLSWFYKTNIMRIEGIGIERDLAGLPVAFVPTDVLLQADANSVAIYQRISEILAGVKRDDQEGIMWPLSYDDSGNLRYDFKLMSSGGSRQFDTSEIIRRYDASMSQSVLADFMQLGHEGVGSFALADSKTNLFGYALGAFADLICDVVNSHAIPKLLAINGMDPDRLPKLRHGDVESADLEALSTYVDKMAGKGLITPDPALEAHLRKIADLPPQEAEWIEEPPDPEQEAKDEADALAALSLASPPQPGGQVPPKPAPAAAAPKPAAPAAAPKSKNPFRR